MALMETHLCRCSSSRRACSACEVADCSAGCGMRATVDGGAAAPMRCIAENSFSYVKPTNGSWLPARRRVKAHDFERTGVRARRLQLLGRIVGGVLDVLEVRRVVVRVQLGLHGWHGVAANMYRNPLP